MLYVEPKSLVDRLFQFVETRNKPQHRRFIEQMITGLLGSKSTLISNVARFLNEPRKLKHTEKRLCRMLCNNKIPWDELKERLADLACMIIKPSDVIAFDPGDIIKEYAQKMEYLYRVHDGSKDTCGNGYEEFAIEAIQWSNGKKTHIPIYQKISNAACPDYISQNHQIIEAIRLVATRLRGKGIWAFDRQHDRSRIIEKALLRLNITWILRVKENRTVTPLNPNSWDSGESTIGMLDFAKKIPYKATARLTFPKKTGVINLGWERLSLSSDPKKTPLTLLLAHDPRNKEPVRLLTTINPATTEEALAIFGYYLERWGKEEGYRFTKSFLNLENIRMFNFNAISNLSFLVFLVYFFVTLFYRSAPSEIDELIDKRLKNFKNITQIKYRYYRVGNLMRLLLCNQLNKDLSCLMNTEVG